jgi:hypothetical protein
VVSFPSTIPPFSIPPNLRRGCQVLPLAYLSGLSLLKRQFRQERSGTASGDANYIALHENSSALFEVGEDEGEDGDPMDSEKMDIIHGKASP